MKANMQTADGELSRPNNNFGLVPTFEGARKVTSACVDDIAGQCGSANTIGPVSNESGKN